MSRSNSSAARLASLCVMSGLGIAAIGCGSAQDASPTELAISSQSAALSASVDAALDGSALGQAGSAAASTMNDAPADLDGGMEALPDAATMPDPADEHCTMDMPADPRDATLDPAPVTVWVGWSRDVLLPQPIVDWLNELGLQQVHDAWHTTRRWDQICGSSFASAATCDYAQQLTASGLWRAQFQQGAPGAGSAFLAMHRHMIGMFKAAFPQHAELFAGFSHVPRTRSDAENPTPWKRLSWSDDNLVGFDILEHIEDNLALFPTEDELGVFIESTFRWTTDNPAVALAEAGAGVHGALHNQWAVDGSPANLGRTDTALPNYIFWKIHGFIDAVWSRYRLATGLGDQDPDYLAVARQECRLMYYLMPEHRANAPAELTMR
jgi:hypothetical protein